MIAENREQAEKTTKAIKEALVRSSRPVRMEESLRAMQTTDPRIQTMVGT